MNPLSIIKKYAQKGITPQDILMQTPAVNSNPMVKNLVEMAKTGDSAGVEKFARNLFNENGRDFDKEFAEFMKQVR